MSLFAQDLPTVIPPSPSVSNLMHFEEVPVSHYTGQPEISLPLYTKKASANFSLPVNLMYNTMGVRVDERSGWTGTGWSISGEAVISRTVRDIADELDQVSNTTTSTNKVVGVYHNGYYDLSWSATGDYTEDVANCNIQDFLWNASGKGSGSFDGDFDNEPDLYQLSLYGATARFVIVKEGTSLVVKMMENDSNLQITLNHNANYEISNFTVLDTKGIQYIFNTADTETSNSSSYSVSIKQNGDPANISIPSDMQYISAWKISEVNTVNGNNLATYTYQNITETFKTPISESNVEIKSMSFANSSGVIATWGNVVGEPHEQALSWAIYNNSILKPKYTKSETTLTIQTKKVSSIDFHDQSRIEFITNNTLNHPEFDTSTAKVLEKVIIKKPNGSVFKTFKLAHSVTPNNRLFLDTVEEIFSTNNSYSYHLAYTNKDELPEFGNPNKDIWGYYKAAESPGLPANCKLKFSADKDKVTTGVLEKITYPTSGIKNFIFESNRFSQIGARAFTEDEFAQYNPDNYTCTTAWGDFNNSNIQNDGYSSYVVPFTNLRTQEVSVRTVSSSGTQADKDNTSIKIVKTNDPLNVDQVIAQVKLDDVELFTLPAGSYEIRLFSLSTPNSNNPVVNVNATVNYKLFQDPLKHYLYGGGLRIKEVFFNENSDLTAKTKTIFSYDVLGGKGVPLPVDTPSSGVIDGLYSNIKEYTRSQKHTVALFNFGSAGNNTATAAMPLDIDYKIVEKLSSIQAAFTKGNYVGYAKVSVRHIKGDTKGSTLYHFTTPVDYPTYGEHYSYPFLPLPDKSHLQGVLTKQEVFNATDQILKEVTYAYHDPIELSVAKSLFVYDEECYYSQFYSTLDHYIASEPTPGRAFMGNSAPYLHGNCINGSSTCEAPVYYKFYDVLFSKYLLKDTITKDYFYTDTQATTGEEVATKQTLFYNPVYYQVSEDRTYLDINDESKYYKTKYHYPSPSTFPVGYNDENGKVSRLQDLNKINDVIATETFKDGVKLTQTNTIYDEQDTNLVLPSKVQVAKGSKTPETRLEYTRYDTYGNILEVKKTSGASISYIWGYNSMYPVAKIENATYTAIETLPSFGTGFTITEALTLTQEADLRSLPNAQVTTFKYDPFVGVISTTDPKDYTMTYEYDAFNRLKYVKDKDDNILSKNEYKYVNQN
ncbi:hypothetical protein [uncultured Lacinutrix sp.]|uniref:hypothetical protein n=1 Tax=uncultured Lacinutrix sp. TaxID=574032 RepID=UPI002611C27E|nr:hypothetical protein [uncultured Lacinutrix sp.]